MTIMKLTDKEFEAIRMLHRTMAKVSSFGGRGSNIEQFFIEKDVTESDMDNLIIDINHSELYRAIERYKNGDTDVVAKDIDGVGFRVVEILSNDYDNVFGFIETEDGKEYHYCETKEFWNDELEEDEIHFFVDDEPVYLNNCIRIWGGR
jgi:hypothetical protein